MGDASIGVDGLGAEVRLLVVDDNDVNRTLLVRLVGALGLGADAARDGLDAERALTSRPYTAVLLDVRMPRKDGPAVARWLRAREAGEARRTPVIAVGADSPVDRETCREAGMDAFVARPVSLSALREVLTPYLLPGGDETTSGAGGVLDLARLDELGDQLGDRSLLRDTVRTYLTEMPRRRNALRTAVRDDDRAAVRLVAHSLRSSSAMLGATSLAQRCAEVERVADDATGATLASLAVRVEALADETGIALVAWLG